MSAPVVDPWSLLSAREAQVAQLVVDGLTNKEIAGRVGISRHTVKTHMHRVFGKCGVENRTGLVACLVAARGRVAPGSEVIVALVRRLSGTSLDAAQRDLVDQLLQCVEGGSR